MAWTKEQEKAIFDRGSNIIVSAGAGSGKTAVLSERILEYCKSGGDIRKILVLTFTKAAASEMKERIRKKLLNNGLLLQADYIDAAYITTFDSYSLALVKKYYYRLGILKDVGIMDELMSNIKRNEIIKELFNELYEEKNERFLGLLARYTTQDDKSMISIIEGLCDKLNLIINIDKFVRGYEANYFSEARIREIVNEYVSLCHDEISDFLIYYENLMEASSLDSASEKLYDTLLEGYNKLTTVNDYMSMYNAINTLKLGTLSRKADPRIKPLKEDVSNKLKELKKLFEKYTSTDDMFFEIVKTKEDILYILSLCDEVLRRLFEYKKEINLFGFTDIARLAIRLVYENEDIANELKAYYDEILVDEYQDTSDMQEVFLTKIENNNRYMVGDIKQSIYRFRNANPYIFKNKYDSYSENKGGEKIDLTYNFRSRSEVLNNINLLFNRLMTDSLGDANYEREHQMRYGQKSYLSLEQDIDFNMDILRYSEDEYYKAFTKEEKEAFIIGKSIKDTLAKRPMILKGDSFKEASYGDFAILIDKAKSFVTFKQIFEYLGIPLQIEADLDLKNSILPEIFTNILALINGLRKKEFGKAFNHAKASLARSFIYEYSDDLIYSIIVNNERTPLDEDLYYLANLKNVSYKDLFFYICDRLDIYNKLSLIGDVDNSLAILENIYRLLNSFKDANMDLDQAISFLNEAFKSDSKLGYSLNDGAKDSVRIMTIHKSKGLEFAYCYFPLLQSSFNKADEKASVGLDSKYGIYIPYADEGKSNTIIKPLVASSIRALDISEKVRLFYVALTRAREKIILVMDDKEIENINPKRLKSFQEMILYANVLTPYIKDIELKDYSLSYDYKKGRVGDSSIIGSISPSYTKKPNIVELHKSHISKELKELPSRATAKAMDLGTLIHEALEVLDFKCPDIDSLPVEPFIKEIVSKVMAMDIIKNSKNGRVFHEHEFYFDSDGEEYHGIIDLFIEYEDHIDIIDYKLSNTDSKEYERQLLIYKKYIESRSAKPANTYLLSLIKQDIKKIEL